MKHQLYFIGLLLSDSAHTSVSTCILGKGASQCILHLGIPSSTLIGSAARFGNVPKSERIHDAIRTGMLAAEISFDIVSSSSAGEEAAEDLQAGGHEHIHAPI
jgi:flavin-dependent dehydrogenase